MAAKIVFPAINSIEDFCRETGWPYDEFMQLLWTEGLSIMALYDLDVEFTFPAEEKAPTSCMRCPLNETCSGFDFCPYVVPR